MEKSKKSGFNWRDHLQKYVYNNLDKWFLYLQMKKTMVVPLGQPYPFLLGSEENLKKFIYYHLSNLRSREGGLALIKLLKTIRSAILS